MPGKKRVDACSGGLSVKLTGLGTPRGRVGGGAMSRKMRQVQIIVLRISTTKRKWAGAKISVGTWVVVHPSLCACIVGLSVTYAFIDHMRATKMSPSTGCL